MLIARRVSLDLQCLDTLNILFHYQDLIINKNLQRNGLVDILHEIDYSKQLPQEHVDLIARKFLKLNAIALHAW